MTRTYLLAATLTALVIGVPFAAGAALDVPPQPTIDSKPANPTNQTDASFGFSDTDGNATFECQLDNGGFSACSSPTSYTGLADGAHTFDVRAVGPGKNDLSEVASYTWTVDATPPVTTITDHPQDPSGVTTASFSFSGDDGAGSGVVGFECKLDGDAFETCVSGKSYSGLGDGNHSFQVRATDAAGNTEPTPASFSWTIDTVNPVVTITAAPPEVTNRTTASFAFSSNKAGSTFECARDGAAFGSCTSPVLYTGLGDGPHTFAVRATHLGNIGLTTGFTWTVDTVAPHTTIASTPPAVSGSASASFSFVSSEPGSTFACSLDSAGFTPCASPQTYVGLGDGSHTFRVEAVDPAGNVDSSAATYSWQIQGVGPETIDHTPPPNVRRLRRAVGYKILKLTWRRPTSSDFDHVRVFVSTSPKSLPRTLVYTGKSTKYTNKRFKNGLYYRYAVVSYDRADNASRGARTVVPPSILLRSPRNGRTVHSPPRLLWTPVAKATFYNVQLYYGSQKVLSTWPNRARVKLAREWAYGGRRFELRRGLYHWFVWPGFGPRSRSHYGQLLGQGAFRVRY
jgi:hypothetical protein